MILDDEDVLIKKSENNLNLLAYLLYEGCCDDNDDNRNSLHRFLYRILKNYNLDFNYGSININKKNLEYVGHISYGFQYLQNSKVMLNVRIYSKNIDIFNIFHIDRNEYVYNISTGYYIYKTTYFFPTKKTS